MTIREEEIAGVGALLKRTVDALCAEHHMTHGELAARAGLAHSNLSRSYRSVNGAAVLLAVCKAFDLRLEVVPNK